MRLVTAFVLAILTFTPDRIQAASFDCGAARTPVERAICSNPPLGALDSRLADLYRGVRETERETQRAWLSKRNECGGDTACLTLQYNERIAELLDKRLNEHQRPREQNALPAGERSTQQRQVAAQAQPAPQGASAPSSPNSETVILRLELGAENSLRLAISGVRDILEWHRRQRDRAMSNDESRRIRESISQDLRDIREGRSHAFREVNRLSNSTTTHHSNAQLTERLSTAARLISTAETLLEQALKSESDAARVVRSREYLELTYKLSEYQQLREQNERAAREREANEERQRQNRIAQAANARWLAYSSRPKTLLEEVMNYTTTVEAQGYGDLYWISGLDGANKCIVTRMPSMQRTVDLRVINPSSFRIIPTDNGWYVGDDRLTFDFSAPLDLLRSRASEHAFLLQRLQRAWELALQECPSNTRSRF